MAGAVSPTFAVPSFASSSSSNAVSFSISCQGEPLDSLYFLDHAKWEENPDVESLLAIEDRDCFGQKSYDCPRSSNNEYVIMGYYENECVFEATVKIPNKAFIATLKISEADKMWNVEVGGSNVEFMSYSYFEVHDRSIDIRTFGSMDDEKESILLDGIKV